MATQIGEAVIKLSFDGKNLKASLDNVSSTVENHAKNTGAKWGSAWVVAAGNLIAKGVSKVASMVTNTMSKAIGRLDTLNNFPKVMTSLGYSAESADKSIRTMSDSLDGLPTSLDAMVGDVQKLAATMGNLADGEINATSVGLGLNNMFLAGGKGTEMASRAMEQYNQMLAAGKADMQSWRTLMDTAPGQMKQLAQELLGASASQEDLRQALNNGTVSFEDLNKAIVKLNQEGGASFASFEEQARSATGGIATQLENIQNTMNKIVAAALEGNLEDIDKYINQLAQRVGDVAPTLIRGFVGAFNALAAALPGIIKELLPPLLAGLRDLLMAAQDYVPEFINMIIEATPLIMDALVSMLGEIVAAIPTIMPQLISALTNLVLTFATQLTRPDFLSLILQGAVSLFMELVKAIPQVLTALINALPEIISNIVLFLLDPANLAMIINAAVELFFGLVLAVPQILGALIKAFGTLVGNLWKGLQQMFGDFAANFGNFIGNIFKKAINGVLTFIENFINAPIDLINGFIGLINDAFSFIGVNLGTIPRISLPRLAQGGIVSNATIAMIGEEGQEAVLPLENNTDNWAGTLATILSEKMEETETLPEGRAINVYMTNEINNRLDAEEIGRTMIQSIRRFA